MNNEKWRVMDILTYIAAVGACVCACFDICNLRLCPFKGQSVPRVKFKILENYLYIYLMLVHT